MTALRILLPRRKWFYRVCTKKLGEPKNLAKTDARRLSNAILLQYLKDEVAELEQALALESPEAAIFECADVANIAGFIADRLHARRPA